MEASPIYNESEALGLDFQLLKRGWDREICWRGSYNALKHEFEAKMQAGGHIALECLRE